MFIFSDLITLCFEINNTYYDFHCDYDGSKTLEISEFILDSGYSHWANKLHEL